MKKSLVLVLFCLSLGITACGRDNGSDSTGSNSGGSSPGGGSSTDAVAGPCTLTGDIRSFQVSCDRAIQKYSVGFMTLEKRLLRSDSQHNTDITNNGTSLAGSENIADSLEIKIIFADSSTASVKLYAH